MATNLYEILEVSTDATPEQIRKAYKKKALQTHPDRLAPGTSPEDKAASEELFRKVNNAYEVLTDPQNRRVYDLHGVWPPPEPESVPLPRRSGGYRPYSQRPFQSNSFFAEPMFEDHHPFFAFTDPFSLFDTIFGDSQPQRPRRHHNQGSWLAPDISRFGEPFGGLGFMGFPSLEPPTFSGASRGQWKSERFETTSANGATQTLHQRRDWDGNEHVTRTYSDGREIHTINGVEQPSSRGYIPHSSQTEARHFLSSTVPRQHRVSARSPASPFPPYPPPPYLGHAPGGYESSPAIGDYSHRHDRRFSETRPVIPDPYTVDMDVDQDTPQHRRRWWGRR